MEVTTASPRWSHPMGSPPGVGQPTGTQNTLVSPARPLPPLALIRFPFVKQEKKKSSTTTKPDFMSCCRAVHIFELLAAVQVMCMQPSQLPRAPAPTAG